MNRQERLTVSLCDVLGPGDHLRRDADSSPGRRTAGPELTRRGLRPGAEDGVGAAAHGEVGGEAAVAHGKLRVGVPGQLKRSKSNIDSLFVCLFVLRTLSRINAQYTIQINCETMA